MYFLLIPLSYICITPNLYEALSLSRSLLLITWVLLFVVVKPHFFKIQSKWQLLIFAIPATYVISAVLNNQNSILALLGNHLRNFGILTLLAVGFLVILGTNEKNHIQSFIKIAILPLTLASIIYSFVQSNGFDPIPWDDKVRVVLTLGNSNYAAALLGVLTIVPIYEFFHLKQKKFKVLILIPFVLIVWAGLNTQAYQYKVLSLNAVLVFLTIYFWPKIQRVSIFLRASVIGFAVSGVAFYVIANRTTLVTETNFADRFAQQKEALQMFFDHPIFGVGVDQHYRYVPMYFNQADILRLGSNLIPDKTHNLVIDHLAMGGVFAGALFVSFLIYSIILTYKINNLGKALENRNEFSLLAGIWLTYVLHLFISTDNIFMMTFGYATFGLISQIYYKNRATENNKKSKSARKFRLSPTSVRVISALMLLGVSVISIQAISSSINVRKILNNQVQSGEQLISILKSFPNPKTTEIVIAKMIEAKENCPLAIIASDNLLKLDNRNSQAWFFKAFCSDAANDPETALTFINNALELFPMSLNYLDAKARIEIQLKNLTAANSTIKQIQEIDPNYDGLAKLELLLKMPISG